jgi:ribosomal protein L7Ae-like RNA K-turn-binding protein
MTRRYEFTFEIMITNDLDPIELMKKLEQLLEEEKGIIEYGSGMNAL